MTIWDAFYRRRLELQVMLADESYSGSFLNVAKTNPDFICTVNNILNRLSLFKYLGNLVSIKVD